MSTFGATNPGPGESTSSSITILLVQGSFQIPEVYGKLVDSLEAQGFPTIHPRLPSCSNVDDLDFPKRSLIDDALVIRSELVRLVEYMNKTVVVVMHSYGGLVGSEAVPEELSYSKRRAQGLTGGVIHLFFFTAFMLNEGQSVLSAFGESPNNDVKVSNLLLRSLASTMRQFPLEYFPTRLTLAMSDLNSRLLNLLLSKLDILLTMHHIARRTFYYPQRRANPLQ